MRVLPVFALILSALAAHAQTALGTISSSRRFKKDIQDMGNASANLMRLRPVTYRYKQSFDDGSEPIQYGLIAEELAEVYPDLVRARRTVRSRR